MILTGEQIKWAQEKGYIHISDWDEKRLNPNSYNLRLADELLVYGWDDKETIPGRNLVHRIELLDMKQELPVAHLTIPSKGRQLNPGYLYLGRTMEYTETHKFVPMLEGRSSVGRLGIQVHSTAGFGDIGFCGYWTLEISCVQPVVIYPEVEICQIYYHTIAPDWNIWIPDDDSVMKYKSGK